MCIRLKGGNLYDIPAEIYFVYAVKLFDVS